MSEQSMSEPTAALGSDGGGSSVKIDGANASSGNISGLNGYKPVARKTLTVFSWVKHCDQTLVKIALKLVFVMRLSGFCYMYLKTS